MCLMTETDSPKEKKMTHLDMIRSASMTGDNTIQYSHRLRKLLTQKVHTIKGSVLGLSYEKASEQDLFRERREIPVRMDWSTRRVVDFIEVTLMSAGTLSPTNEKKKKLRVYSFSTLQ